MLQDTWTISPRASDIIGNSEQQVPSKLNESFRELEANAYSASKHDFIAGLASGVNKLNVITQDEVAEVMQLHAQGEEVWTLVKDFGGRNKVRVHRHEKQHLFNGSMFGKLSAHLPDAPMEVVIHAVFNTDDRTKWDKQVAGFQSWPAPNHNTVMRYRMHASPFSNRDFAVFQVIACHDGGKGVLCYQRWAGEKLVPLSNDVRGRISLLATIISTDPTGGTCFSNVTVLDPHIPFMPKWVINAFIPSEFSKWVACLDKRCAELVTTVGLDALPCKRLFSPTLRPAPAEQDFSQVLPSACERVLDTYKSTDTTNENLRTSEEGGKGKSQTIALETSMSANSEKQGLIAVANFQHEDDDTAAMPDEVLEGKPAPRGLCWCVH